MELLRRDHVGRKRDGAVLMVLMHPVPRGRGRHATMQQSRPLEGSDRALSQESHFCWNGGLFDWILRVAYMPKQLGFEES